MLSWVEHKKSFIISEPGLLKKETIRPYEQSYSHFIWNLWNSPKAPFRVRAAARHFCHMRK